MTRAIKFRAWTGKEMRFPPAFDEWDTEDFGFFIEYNKKPTTLMQFTGLLDKNGKEIWEGDVVKAISLSKTPSRRRRNVAIEFIRSWNRNGWNVAMGENYEVIGNIYENPELLKN